MSLHFQVRQVSTSKASLLRLIHSRVNSPSCLCKIRAPRFRRRSRISRLQKNQQNRSAESSPGCSVCPLQRGQHQRHRTRLHAQSREVAVVNSRESSAPRYPDGLEEARSQSVRGEPEVVSPRGSSTEILSGGPVSDRRSGEDSYTAGRGGRLRNVDGGGATQVFAQRPEYPKDCERTPSQRLSPAQ